MVSCLSIEHGESACNNNLSIRLQCQGQHLPACARIGKGRVQAAVRIQAGDPDTLYSTDAGEITSDDDPAIWLNRNRPDSAVDVRVETVNALAVHMHPLEIN